MGIKTIQNFMLTSNPLKKFQKFCIQKSKRKNTVIFVQKDNKNMFKGHFNPFFVNLEAKRAAIG
jgi:hypothetical protein